MDETTCVMPPDELVREFVWVDEHDQGIDDPIGSCGWQLAGSTDFAPGIDLNAHDVLHHEQGDSSIEQELVAFGHWLFESRGAPSKLSRENSLYSLISALITLLRGVPIDKRPEEEPGPHGEAELEELRVHAKKHIGPEALAFAIPFMRIGYNRAHARWRGDPRRARLVAEQLTKKFNTLDLKPGWEGERLVITLRALHCSGYFQLVIERGGTSLGPPEYHSIPLGEWL